MKCPRCGFPATSEPCRLCGQTDFDDYELNRFIEQDTARYDITIYFSEHEFQEHIKKVPEDVTSCVSGSSASKFRYLFFTDESLHKVSATISTLKPIKNRGLLVNGRPRPYFEELWLPLVNLLGLSKLGLDHAGN